MMAYHSTPSSTCGVGYVYDFEDDEVKNYRDNYTNILMGTMGVLVSSWLDLSVEIGCVPKHSVCLKRNTNLYIAPLSD